MAESPLSRPPSRTQIQTHLQLWQLLESPQVMGDAAEAELKAAEACSSRQVVCQAVTGQLCIIQG
jgi:hypothetical protein